MCILNDSVMIWPSTPVCYTQAMSGFLHLFYFTVGLQVQPNIHSQIVYQSRHLTQFSP